MANPKTLAAKALVILAIAVLVLGSLYLLTHVGV